MEESRTVKRSAEIVVGLLAFILMLTAGYAIFYYAPMERVMREVQKIFYIHVGTAWNAFLAFFLVFLASIIYLRTRDRRWDNLAGASAEIGVLFTTLVLVTGPIWGSSAWGTWWTWEPRLTTALVLWLIYLGYLAIRAAVPEPQRRGMLAAVFGIIGFADVPIVYFSIVLWGSKLHPQVIGPGGGGMDPRMLVTLIITVFAFTALLIYLLFKRLAVEEITQEVAAIKDDLRSQLDAI